MNNQKPSNLSSFIRNAMPSPSEAPPSIVTSAPDIQSAETVPAPAAAVEGGMRFDGGKSKLHFIPWSVLSRHIHDDVAYNMAHALHDWVRRRDIEPDGSDDTTFLESCLTPDLIAGVANVLEFGAGKYAPYNWEKGLHFTRIANSGLRHALRLPNGLAHDDESQLPHLHHLACNVVFAIHAVKSGWSQQGFDDRPVTE